MTPHEQLIANGKKAMDAGEYQQAVEMLGKAYGEERSFENNWQFTKALYQNGQAETALTIAKEFIGEYMFSSAGYEFYFQLCLAAGAFIDARRLALESEEVGRQRQRVKQLNEAEQNAREENGELIKKRARELTHLAAFDSFTQQQIYQESLLLPFDEYLTAIKRVLLDPDCLPLVRMTILIDSQSLLLNKKLTYLYIDGKVYTTKIDESTRPVTHPVYEQARDYLQKTIGQNDPVNYEMLLEQLRLEVHALFPQINRVSDPIAWVQKDIKQYLGVDTENKWSESAEQKELHETVHRFLTTLGV